MNNFEQAISLTKEAIVLVKEKKDYDNEIKGRIDATEYNSIVHLIVHCTVNPLNKKEKGALIRAMMDAGRTDNDAILVCGIANNRKVQKAAGDSETFADAYAALQKEKLTSKTALRNFTKEEKKISEYAIEKAQSFVSDFVGTYEGDVTITDDAADKLLALLAKAIDAAIQSSATEK